MFEDLKVLESVKVMIENGCLVYEGTISRIGANKFILNLKDVSGYGEDINEEMTTKELNEFLKEYKLLERVRL